MCTLGGGTGQPLVPFYRLPQDSEVPPHTVGDVSHVSSGARLVKLAFFDQSQQSIPMPLHPDPVQEWIRQARKSGSCSSLLMVA